MRSKNAIKNIIATLLQQMIVIICGFIVPKIIIVNFGSTANGIVTSITQFLSYISLLDLGVGAVVKSTLYKPIANKNKEEIENILATSEKFFKLISKILIAYIIILLVIYPNFVGEDFEKSFTVSLIIIIAISSFAEYYFGITYKLFLQADQKSYIISYFQILTTILNTLCVVIFAKLGAGLILVKLLSSLVYALKPILQNMYVKKIYGFELKKSDNTYKLEQKWDALAQHIASVIHLNTDVMVLTIFSSVGEVSVYSVYLLVINGIRRLIEAFYNGIDASFGDMIAKNEIEHLNKSFSAYELLYLSMVTIIFGCTAVLLLPFVKLYTSGITDINYIRPTFSIIIVLAECIYSIRLPYSSLTKAAGHYKETRTGAWIEAGINLFLSIILVMKFGMIGVAIGTLVAMIIRTCEFSYHTSKYVLKRKLNIVIKKIIISLIQLFIISTMFTFIINLNYDTYMNWIFSSIIVFVTSIIIVFGINLCIFKNDIKNVLEIFKRLTSKLKKGEKNEVNR